MSDPPLALREGRALFTRTLTPLEILHPRYHTACDLERGDTRWLLPGEGPAFTPFSPGPDFIAKIGTLAIPHFIQVRGTLRGRGQDYRVSSA